MNLILWYMNVEEEEDMSIENVDVSDGLTEQKMGIGRNVNVKNVGNNENKVSNKDRVSATPNHGTSLFELFWNSIGSGESNQAGLNYIVTGQNYS